MVLDGYTRPIDTYVIKLKGSKMNNLQKKDHKNRHRSKTILMNIISYSKYEKITNRDPVMSIFDSLKMTDEENEKVKRPKPWL